MVKTKSANILSLIEEDHRKVEKLFEQAKTAEGTEIYAVFNEIYTEINLHSRAEELSFYPAMREYDQTAGYLQEAEQEHEEVEVLLEKMKEMKPDDPAFKEMLEELKAAVKHHVEEEENEIFDAVRGAIGEQELIELGGEFQTAKVKSEADVQEAIVQ